VAIHCHARAHIEPQLGAPHVNSASLIKTTSCGHRIGCGCAAGSAAFKKQMVADHRSTVAAFQKAASSARDAELKAWVQKTLPTLQDHLKMAQDLPG